MKTTAYILSIKVWNSNDYFDFTENDVSCNHQYTDNYLFSSEEKAEAFAATLGNDDDETYYEGMIYRLVDMDADDLMFYTSYDSEEEYMADFNEAIDSGEEVSSRIISDTLLGFVDDYYWVDIENHDFDKSLEGSILVFWSWERHVGYARKCLEVREARADETERLLTKEDMPFTAQCDILLTADEVRNADNLQEAVAEALGRSDWKWTNTGFVKSETVKF